MFVQHRIDNIVNAADCAGLFNVSANGVAFQLSCTCIIGYHHAMILLNGRRRRHTGHDCLSATGIAGKVVELNIAQTDTHICLRYDTGDIYRRACFRHTHVHAVTDIAVYAPDLAVAALTHQFFDFLFRVLAVRTQGQNDGDILRTSTAGVQFIQHRGQHIIAGQWTGNIAGNDGYFLPLLHDLPQKRCANGIFQCVSDSLFTAPLVVNRIGLQHCQKVLFLYFYGLYAVSITKFQFHRCAPFLNFDHTGAVVKRNLSQSPRP